MNDRFDNPAAPMRRAAEDAGEALAALADGPAQKAAADIEAAFARAGDAVGAALGKAAATGELSFENLAQRVLTIFADLAIDRLVAGPLERAIGSIGGAVFGARADGGPVVPGGAYLVGERGPEIFRPASAGEIGPVGRGGGVTVHLHLGAAADAGSVLRSQGQIAAMLARAVARGQSLT